MNPANKPHYHIVNGDSTLALLRETSVTGEFLVWPDMLMDGPLPVRKDGTLDWPRRATFLSARYGIPRQSALARMRAFAKALASASRKEAEITLWFEEDFFCQIHLVYLLATLAGTRRQARLSVICPAKPLGTLRSKTLERLFAARRTPDSRCIALSRKVWSLMATQAGKPSASGRHGASSTALAAAWKAETRLADLIRDKHAFVSWPRLRRGLAAHLDRRPASAGPYQGLGSIEAALVKAMRSAGKRPMAFGDAFRKVVSHPRVRPLGLGDVQVARVARDLASREGAPIRLLGAAAGNGKGVQDPFDFRRWRLAGATRQISPR